MIAKHLLLIRRLVQTLSVFILVFIIWNTRYPLSGFINPEFYFLIDPFAMFITAVAERVFLPGLIYSALLLVITFAIGRAFCGWICPLGALLDFLSWSQQSVMKLFRKKTMEHDPLSLRHIKYAILAGVFIFALFGIQLAWFLDPITIFVRTFSFNVHPFITGVIDGGFMRLLKITDYPIWLESMYNTLREGFLSLSTPKFFHTGIILVVLAVIMMLSLVKRRFWCRYLCPLGATLALTAKGTFFQRDAGGCKKNCGVCMNLCRMNAIRSDNSYIREECILCLDCVVLCPNDKTSFFFKKLWGSEQHTGGQSKHPGSEQNIWVRANPVFSRAQFILMLHGLILTSLGATAPRHTRNKPQRPGTESNLRPPGALPEEEFVQRCIRCGNCMKVCPTNVLQPSSIGKGLGGTWSPVLDTRRGYCEYQCNLCGKVCPTDAIRELTIKHKQQFKIGLGVFNKKICLPYAKGENCIVCEEHCPVPDKAIKIRTSMVRGKLIKLPYVDTDLCIGCAICELKCPTAPDKGIVVIKVRDA
ncbi:MAG: hypothetical protein A2176_03000 [Spirochaetes bacterium RBG_13_51_14]|nr:MAG: hypothetical protein A2176_03000 [Spirochaetes bacterium RBG_13_51_14]